MVRSRQGGHLIRLGDWERLPMQGLGEFWGFRRNELTGEDRLYSLVPEPCGHLLLAGRSQLPQPCRDSSGTSTASCTPPLTSPTARL